MLNKTLANKYRPKNFLELKGQEVLVKILSNAVESKKIANAYILTGIRGVGKTTTARIVAKTINCTNIKVTDSIPVPCEECKNCVSINLFNHPDVIEIDAASKTGVNDIREIIENSQYKAVLGLYKIYIIDEVHMLSNSAFNALLKTLEEPPENVLFIFATTEIQKVPATILSRCQRFDLLRLTQKEIAAHLEYISNKENIKHSRDSLDLIAKFSEGSVRDSLSLLETINLYKKESEEISVSLVTEVLGLPKLDSLYDLLSNIISGNTETCLSLINSMYGKGIEMSVVMEELLHISNKASKSLVIKNFIEEGDLFDYEKPLLEKIKSKIDVISITNIWKMLFNGFNEIKSSNYPLNVFEMVIIRACHLSQLPSPETIIKRLSNTTQKVAIEKNNTETEKPLSSFRDLANLFYKHQELITYKQLIENIKIIRYEYGLIEAVATTILPDNFTKNVITKLDSWTNKKWIFTLTDVSNTDNVEKTIKEQEIDKINSNEIIKSIYNTFPGTKITNIAKIKT